MKKFIAYFDYLGFEKFIENNDLEYQKKILVNNFIDMESALGQGKLKNIHGGYVADFSDSKINCINFSDTVVFWTNDDSKESLLELIQVANEFNWRTINYSFPVRGSLVFGEIEYIDFKQVTNYQGLYNVNSVFGKGLVAAHLKAESQNWAGTVIDESIIKEIETKNYNIEKLLVPYSKKYKVPYKNNHLNKEEFVMCLVSDILDELAFESMRNNIKRNFAHHNKSVKHKDVQEKISNTIKFLESFLE